MFYLSSVAIYARRSEEKETGESVKNQLNICRNYAERHFPEAEIDEYFDDDYSGRNMNRPDFQKMMKLAKNGYYEAVIVWKLDRIARNALDFLDLHKELEKAGVKFISESEGFDPSTAAGKLMMIMLAAVAEMERKNISQRVSTNMNEMAKLGMWTGGVVPFGYTTTVIDGRKYLVEDANNIKIVRSAFDKYIETESLFKVANWIKSEYGINKYATDIKRWLNNLVYVKSDADIEQWLLTKNINIYGEINGNGLISYGKVDKTKDIGVEYRSEKDWIVAVGKHNGIVFGSEYIKVQNIIFKRTNSGRRGTGNPTFLNGICRCKYCGSYMRTKTKGNYKYFACGKKDSYINECKNRQIRIELVEKMFLEKVQDKNILDIAIKESKNNTSKLKAEVEKKNNQIKKLVQKISLADDLEDIFMEQIRILKDEIAELELNIRAKEKENLLNEISNYNKKDILSKLSNFNVMFNQCKDNTARRNFIKPIIKTVYLDGIEKSIELVIND